MNRSSAVRTAVATVAAVLCLGVLAPPAVAHPSGSGESEASAQHQAPSLQDVQSFVDTFITNKLARLSAISAKVAADSHLSAAVQSAITSAIEKEQAALTALKAEVDSATSVKEVRSDVRAALAAMAPRLWRWWFLAGLHRRAADRDGDRDDAAEAARAAGERQRFAGRLHARLRFGAGFGAGAWARYHARFGSFGTSFGSFGTSFGSFGTRHHHFGGWDTGFRHHR